MRLRLIHKPFIYGIFFSLFSLCISNVFAGTVSSITDNTAISIDDECFCNGEWRFWRLSITNAQ
ncbi:MAG: hypothetical protein FJ218_07025 [Ignavibacteria bacterium]|nr:hypothetical protein [Ignavibacteria bacterium]